MGRAHNRSAPSRAGSSLPASRTSVKGFCACAKPTKSSRSGPSVPAPTPASRCSILRSIPRPPSADRSARESRTCSGTGSADDLTALLRLMLRNREALDCDGRRVSRPWRRRCAAPRTGCIATRGRAAGATSPRTTISATISSSSFLDETMMYSCALFERAGHVARARHRPRSSTAICRKLALGPQRSRARDRHRLGRLRAARGAARPAAASPRRRSRRPSTSLRASAYRAAGLDDRITVLLEDYRDLAGTYDKLVSIEMIEAIGHQYFDDVLPPLRRAA